MSHWATFFYISHTTFIIVKTLWNNLCTASSVLKPDSIPKSKLEEVLKDWSSGIPNATNASANEIGSLDKINNSNLIGVSLYFNF